MKKIVLRGFRCASKNVKVEMRDASGTCLDVCEIERLGRARIAVDLPEDHFAGIRFGADDMSSYAYCGALAMGIERKRNAKLGKRLTYFTERGLDCTGRVDNYVLEDAKNLSHRADKSKKVSVFVPAGYDGLKAHDVLYFFDAQNLFSKAGKYTKNGDPYGSWQLDVVLGALHEQYGRDVIVVGIDNADEYRDRELFMNPADFGELSPLATALPDENYTVGHLDGLLDFMMQTLHPFIREKYCIKEDEIGIGGASMGGIAAFYCGLRESEFFKYVLAYSPAFGLYEMSAFSHYFEKQSFCSKRDALPKIHIYCGEGDPLERLLIGASRAMSAELVRYGYPEDRIFETFDTEKPHNEESWRLILPQSFTYLLDLK